MNTGKLTKPFRDLGLMHLLDQIKFVYQKWKNRQHNAQFVQANPDVKLPPDYMLFEAFQLDYQKYYEGGEQTARWLMGLFERYTPLTGKNLLDWGCGPARVLRHFPKLLGNTCEIHGTDYNPKTIAWCRENIGGVTFAINQLNPPTQYQNAYFDLMYGISIFTHLSEPNHQQWFDELMRISKKGAILVLTTHGDVFREKLTEQERQEFDQGKLVARGKVVEGHRVFAAFHPPAYIRQLFEPQADILEHIAGTRKNWGLEQDVWILKKRN
ncbi:MAG: class I SAM-dependent methyltransferase [Saprospiraceae bacterium]|nr:class I SAM-dependent methyltransferase [Saprospiraceae bacterium]